MRQGGRQRAGSQPKSIADFLEGHVIAWLLERRVELCCRFFVYMISSSDNFVKKEIANGTS